MRRNLWEDVDVWENYGKIWARRYAGGSGKWEELSESEKIKYQSKLREQALAAGMPEDMSAMSPPPKMSSIAPPAANKAVSRDVMDEARRLADMKIAKSHMAQIEAQRQQRIEKQQRDILEAVKKEIAQRRVDRAERQFQIARDVYNRGGDAQELSDRFRLDLLGELRDSFWNPKEDRYDNEVDVWPINKPREYENTLDDWHHNERIDNINKDRMVNLPYKIPRADAEAFFGPASSPFTPQQLSAAAAGLRRRYEPVEASPFTAQQINAAAEGLRQGYEPVGTSPFTAEQINEAAEGLQSTAADQSGIWGMTPPQLAEAEKRYQQELEAKRQGEQVQREQLRTKVLQERKAKAIEEAYDRYIKNESLPEDQIYFQHFRAVAMPPARGADELFYNMDNTFGLKKRKTKEWMGDPNPDSGWFSQPSLYGKAATGTALYGTENRVAPTGDPVKDATRAFFKTAKLPFIDITQQGEFPEVFDLAGFTQDEDGVYHAKKDPLQQYAGYNDLYDVAFDLGTSMKAEPFKFTYGGEDYVLWAWKGDYLNLGAGAELGIYKRLVINGEKTDHWVVDQSLSMPMTLKLEDRIGNTIADYKPEETQWWITGFNPFYQNVDANYLKATYTVNFEGKPGTGHIGDTGMYYEFKDEWSKKDPRWTFDDKTHTATFTF